MSTDEDGRGEQLAEEIDTVDYIIHSENETTRLPTNGRSTWPDISLSSNNIALLSDWSVSMSLASDHLPNLITINSELSSIDGHRRNYSNFTKADWARHAEACDEFLAEAAISRTVDQVEKTFGKAVTKVSGVYFHAGHIRHFQPTAQAAISTSAFSRYAVIHAKRHKCGDPFAQIVHGHRTRRN